MFEPHEDGTEPGEDYVAFAGAGDTAKGSFRCAECGYGIVAAGGLPLCPMCGGKAWEVAEWSPFRRTSPLL